MIEVKLQVFLLLARKTCTFWEEVYFLIQSFPEHISLFLSLSLFALMGEFNQVNWNSSSLTYSFSSIGSSQVLPYVTKCASPSSPGWWNQEDLLRCPLLAEVALLYSPTGKVLMLFTQQSVERKTSCCKWGSWQHGSRNRATGMLEKVRRN